MTLGKIGTTLAGLWKKMADAGVQDIVYVLYAKAANSGRLKEPEKNNAALEKLCGQLPPPARCFTLNTDDLVKSDLAIDGIHPLAAANDRVAKALMDLMMKEGMRR
jgi:hypothetical protein